jgi:hypothetical protein
MHHAQDVANRLLTGIALSNVSSRALTSAEARTLTASLHDDARDAIYSGALSIAEAIQGIDRKLYTWATVKLYYSVFYLARASLGLHGTGIIYHNKSPYVWAAIAGETPTKRAGTTHKAALNTFKQYRSSSALLSQQIGAEDPFNWLMARRESANYRDAKFCDPGAPSHFKFVENHGVRRLVNDYVADDTHLFTFDPDHAMLAFPIAALKLLQSELEKSPIGKMSQVDSEYLASQAFDIKGPIAELRKLLLTLRVNSPA